MDTTALILVTVLIVAFLVGRYVAQFDPFTISQTRYAISDVDGLPYRVHDYEDKRDAVNMLASTSRRVTKVLSYMRDKYIAKAQGTAAQQRAVALMLSRYNPDNIAENAPCNPDGDTSYSLDKGRVLAFCIRDKANGKLHDENIIMFVALHELAHLSLHEVNHPPIFWRAFKFILNNAAESGVYVSVNYTEAPQYYCGLHVNHNPFYDPTIAPLS